MMNDETRAKLKGVSTATLASALYKRGLRHQMIQDVRPLSLPKGGSMVGEAYTLRYMPAREDLNPITVFRDPGHPQRRAVEECPPGAVLVMDSRKDPCAASAGGILATRLMVVQLQRPKLGRLAQTNFRFRCYRTPVSGVLRALALGGLTWLTDSFARAGMAGSTDGVKGGLPDGHR